MEVAADPSLTVALLVIVFSFLGAILSDKLRVSYATVMVALGLGLSVAGFSGWLGNVPIGGSLILGLVVPPTIFEAAMRTRYDIFRSVHRTVLSLSIFGVILSAIVTAVVLNVALGLPLGIALTFGIMLSPTDPVSVASILKRMRAPEGLSTILESEAYFNNATPVILYPIAISLSFSPLQSITLFIYTFGGGILIGFLVSGIAELLYRQITEPLAETSFTMAVLFGSYVFAETLGVSGLMAVAISGLYMGNRTMRTAMSEETRTTMATFWEVVTFVVTSFALLIIGMKTDFWSLVAYAPFILAAFLAILLARVFSVYSVLGVTRVMGERIPNAWTKVLAMAGLRGAVSIALALSLPASPYNGILVAMTFGVVLLSLIVQGESLQIYLKTRKLQEAPEGLQHLSSG